MLQDCYSGNPALMPEDEAIRLLCGAARAVKEQEQVPLAEAYGRVLAASPIAPIDVPSSDNSAMDGYAVRAQDISPTGVTRLPVSQRIIAGDTGAPLMPHTAGRIFTGAAMPPGADTVIKQEYCEAVGNDILIQGTITAGAHIRRAGEDVSCGSEVLRAGIRLQPQHVGLAASVGLSELPVYRKIKVAVFFTGNELLNPGQPVTAGKIYNSNRYILIGLLQQLGCDVIDVGDIPDDYSATCTALEKAKASADIIITSGGVSVGEEDYVRTAVDNLGELKLWNIAVKPGKPLAFARLGDTPFIGLPGNPVSAFITFVLYARPLLLLTQGRSYSPPNFLWAQAGFERQRGHGRREYLRARIETAPDESNVAHLYHHQGSGVLSSITWADGLVCLPDNETVQRGQMVRYLPLAALLD